MDGEQEPKISLVEIIFIGLIFALFDLVEVVIVLFALDDFWIIDITTSIIFFYLFIKGIPPMRQLICWLLELIPWVGALPLLTIGWVLTVWADRHPSGALAKAGRLAGTAKGRAALAKGAEKTRGIGARSFQQMGKAEGRAAELKARAEERLSPSERAVVPPELPSPESQAVGGRPSMQPTGRRNVDGVGSGGVETGSIPAAGAEGAPPSAPRIAKRSFGEKPTPFEELEEFTEEPPPQPVKEEDEEQSFPA